MHDPRRRREKTLTTTWDEDRRTTTQIMFGLILLITLAITPWTLSGIAYIFAKIIALLFLFWAVFSTLGQAYSSGGRSSHPTTTKSSA